MVHGTQHWDRAGVLENMDGDEDLVDAVLEIFLESAPDHLTTLRAALETSDAPAIEKAAHSLKGELGYLEVPELLQMARDLEVYGRTNDMQNAAHLFSSVEILVNGLIASIWSSRSAQ
jgi:HPt (histidine-containing phosphotransfer) domain-containing protein